MSGDRIDFLPVAIRVHAVRQSHLERDPDADKRRRPTMRELPQRTLVIDCETTTDEAQQLRFGVWRLYVDAQDARPGSVCHHEGIFYADNLSETDPEALATLREIVRTGVADVSPGHRRRIQLMSRTEFVERILWRWGHQQQATIVGFNLPFDLTRLAILAAPARGRNSGGISLRLWGYQDGDHPYRPRIVLRTIDAYRTLMQFSSTADKAQHYRGKFLDLRTLTFAHTDERGLTLESACDRFGVPYTKRDVTHGAVLTPDYVTYGREDVAATAALFRAAHVEHSRHPIAVPARNAFSAATLGKGYWDAFGIPGFQDRDVSWLDHEVAGWGMAAFYGGRAECRIRRVDVPVVYTDFRSMYTTCNALMDTWRLLTSEQLTVTENTLDVQRLLDAPDLHERFFDPAMWPQLHTLVEVEPNGAILPVRARYDPTSPTWGIGVNPYTSTRTCWYPLADIIAAIVLGGPKPIIVRAVRIGTTGSQPTLKNAKLMGDIEINPKLDDFFTRTVELRTSTRNDPTIDPAHRARLGTFLKVLANSTGYGILAQYDRKHEPTPVPVVVHADRPAFTVTTNQPEDPGTYCAPPIAACVTGAARLMLALLERQVTDLGGTYAFCDTDSMAIVATKTGGPVACPGGTTTTPDGTPAVHALSWKTVDRIVERFTALNPYNRTIIPGSILKIEDDNYLSDRRGRRRQQQLYSYMISAKRYRLATTNGRIIKRSEHGLGHLLNPTPDHADWITQAWQYLIDPTGSEPVWLDQPALSRMTVTSPEALAWFAPINRHKTYPDQIKPANFLLIAHPDPLDPNPAQPVAAYHPDRDWRTLDWIDRHTGLPVTITTRPLDGNQRPETRVTTYRDVLTDHLNHTETKALTHNHTGVRADTTGILTRRPVHAIQPVTYIGKEAHDLDNRAHGITTDDQAVTTYPAPDNDTWTTLTVPVLTTVPTATIATDTGVNLRTIQRAIHGHNTPHPRDRANLHKYALHIARAATNAARTENHNVTMYRFLQFAQRDERDITAGKQLEGNAPPRNCKTTKLPG